MRACQEGVRPALWWGASSRARITGGPACAPRASSLPPGLCGQPLPHRPEPRMEAFRACFVEELGVPQNTALLSVCYFPPKSTRVIYCEKKT